MSFTDYNMCRLNNGGCSHLCINNEGHDECQCRDGYKLNEDGKTCTGQEHT